MIIKIILLQKSIKINLTKTRSDMQWCIGAGTVPDTGTGYDIFKKIKVRVRPYIFF
jgi:hypothetical protein